MTYSNVQFKNSGNDEGDVLNFFNNHLRTLIQKNGGDNTFSIVCENCHDKDYPVPMKTKTKLHLTHSAHTISQIEKGFITVELDFKLKFNEAIKPEDWFIYDNEIAPLTEKGADAIATSSKEKAQTFKDEVNNGTNDKHPEYTNLDYIFVGFKNAVELISELKFWIDGRLVDNYNQQEMIKESFAYNSIKPRDSKYCSPNSHSLWESVCCMSPNVAGVYIPMNKFVEMNNQVPVHMELTIPFTDQLALQAWRLYPNRILGELEEEVQFCLDALVWCQIQPHAVGEIKKFWEYGPDDYYEAPWLPITNHFSQINTEAIIVQKHKIEYLTADLIPRVLDEKPIYKENRVINDDAGFDGDNYVKVGDKATSPDEKDDEDEIDDKEEAYSLRSIEPQPTTMGLIKNTPTRFRKILDYIPTNDEKKSPPLAACLTYVLGVNRLEIVQNDARVKRCRTNCAGFGVKPQVIEGILQGMHEPIIIPAQEITKYQFEMKAVNNRLNLNKSIPLRNATNITMMFPLHDNDVTVYKNIMFDGVKLTVNKKVYPETEFEHTWGGRFIQYQLQANELDGTIEATQEFMESISRPLNDVYEFTNEKDKRLVLCPFDNTSFGINFQLERGNSGYVFDGIDTGSHAINIEFSGYPHSRETDKNPYYYADLKVEPYKGVVVDTKKHERPHPEMWVCSDTYWTWSVEDGVKYYPRGIPAGFD